MKVKFCASSLTEVDPVVCPDFTSVKRTPAGKQRCRSLGSLILRNIFFGQALDAVPDSKDERSESTINAECNPRLDNFDLIRLGSDRAVFNDTPSPQDIEAIQSDETKTK